LRWSSNAFEERFPQRGNFLGLREKVRSDDIEELSRRDDLCILPEFREITFISGDQVIGPRGVGALYENIVGWVTRDIREAWWEHVSRVIVDQLQELLPKPLPNSKLRTAKDPNIFVQNWVRHMPPNRFVQCEEQNRPL
jgi:hypothetical protein